MDRTGWTRISDHLRATTGRELRVGPDPRYGWAGVEVWLDGRLNGSVGGFPGDTTEEWVAEMANVLREFTLDEEIWGGWPPCPIEGHTHMLEGGLAHDIASWFCPRGSVVARIGELDTGRRVMAPRRPA